MEQERETFPHLPGRQETERTGQKMYITRGMPVGRLTRLSLVMAVAGSSAMADTNQPRSTNEMDSTPQTVALSAHSPSRAAGRNKLANESSPYLLQHASNPVNWYPWGDEAFQLARKENKPIFLSIGYSACHWCHVMEEESFANEQVAAILNKYYVAIKVDREERPDVDEIYMTAVQIMTGQGGWPLNVFLTPDLQPFYGGTYFPPQPRYGRPSFGQLLERIAQAWQEDQQELIDDAGTLTAALTKVSATDHPEAERVDSSSLRDAKEHLESAFDQKWGGFSPAPKFPGAAAISLLLRDHIRTQDKASLQMVTRTLDAMACGGMYDQLGGGFHRYSTDVQWLVPHFEKMLYDNALLSNVYLEAWQVTDNSHYRQVAQETLDYVIRDMTDASGGFHSSQDADSEGVEGKFYVWDRGEVEETLGPDDAAFFCKVYGVTKKGNFEDSNILHLQETPEDTAQRMKISAQELQAKLSPLKDKLLSIRDRRIPPPKDDKIIAAWNGMMISAMAYGYEVLGDARYKAAAESAAEFVLKTMVRDGLLMRSCRPSCGTDFADNMSPAYLDDYAEMANGLIDLYQATFETRWVEAADRLIHAMIEEFWNDSESLFYFSAKRHGHLLVRTTPLYDGSVPAGNSSAALALLRLSVLMDRPNYRQKAESLLGSVQNTVANNPTAFLNMLEAVDFATLPTTELVVVGDIAKRDTQDLLNTIRGQLVPNRVIALVNPNDSNLREKEDLIPLLKGKTMVTDRATVYVCENLTCKEPVTEVDALQKTLNKR